MSISLFISLFVACAAMTGLLTQAIKQFYYNRNSDASPNVIALANAIVVGGLGTAFAYMLIGIPWTVNNILCLIAMVILVWMGSMIGYAKIIETISQFKIWQSSNDINKLKEILNEEEKE